MQQYHGRDKSSSSIRTRRTQPALPGATMPTVPLVTPSQQRFVTPYEPQSPSKKRLHPGRHAVLQLLGLGILLEALYLGFYPLLAAAVPKNDVAKQALPALFSWTARLYWTTAFPVLGQELAGIPLLNPAGGNINFLLLLLGLSFVLVLIAGRVGSRAARERLSGANKGGLFTTIVIITLVFAVTYLFAPVILSQDMFLYGLYGRLVTVYHVNPYSVSLSAFSHDLLHQGLVKGMPEPVSPGPVWIDLSIPVVLLARESVANVLFGFRVMGLAAHLMNVMLIWVILAKLKPETRISATLLYAWNPLVLLLSVSSMHLDVMLVLFFLLAILFFQRNSPILGWVLVLLAMLINIFCLLFLPLFFRLLAKEARKLKVGRRVLWWLSVLVVSGVVVVLAFAPYWEGWGISGWLASMQQAFLQNTAINSLDAALLNLPVKLPPLLAWLLIPQHWTIFAIVTVGCLLLLGLWLADTIELVVLFSSWIFLALLVLLPVYWPWYMILPLALALISASRRTLLLAFLLTLGAIGSWCFWLRLPVWPSQALVTVGLPLLLWGWILFFTSTWEMTHANEAEQAVKPQRRRGLSRPSFPSRPSWPGRRR